MNVNQVFNEITIGQLKPPKPLTIESNKPVKLAIQNLKNKNVGCIVVVEGVKILGVFTERDLIKKVLGKIQDYQEPVNNFMTPNPDTIYKKDTLGKAMEKIYDNDYRHLPVLDENGILCGLFSVRTAMNYLAELFPMEALNLPPEPNIFPKTQEGG